MILKKESIASTKGADNRWRPIINSLKHKGFLSSWDLYLQYILKWATDFFFFYLEIYCETIWFFSTQSHFSNVLCNNLLFPPKALILLFFKPLFNPSLKKKITRLLLQHAQLKGTFESTKAFNDLLTAQLKLTQPSVPVAQE